MADMKQKTPQQAREAPVAGPFKVYAPKCENQAGRVDLAEAGALWQLREIWKACRYDGAVPVSNSHSNAIAMLAGLKYGPEDVTAFSILMKEFQREDGFSDKAGVFLSALINNGPEGKYAIMTEHLAIFPKYIGYSNQGGRDITINGHAGDQVGKSMAGGSITVKGNVGDWAGCYMSGGCLSVGGNAGDSLGGYMSGGSITVKGNVGDWAGGYMTGGSITLKGKAAAAVGLDMRGGEIHVDGEYGNIDYHSRKGRIYHKGKLHSGKRDSE